MVPNLDIVRRVVTMVPNFCRPDNRSEAQTKILEGPIFSFEVLINF